MPEPRTRLAVQLRHRIGALELNIEFELTQPWTILFGASGSGKTTILRAIAGLLRPDAGRIVLSREHDSEGEHTVLVDTASKIFVPAHARRIPLAPQRASLFPHRTVAENIHYGMAVRKGATPREQLRSVLNDFHLDHLADKYPPQLSGGEAERVNLARAVAARGRLLLLDEPFTGLDAPTRERLQSTLIAISHDRAIPILSVTHDVAEPFQVDAEVIRLDQGRIVRQGPANEVLANERARLLDLLRHPPTAPASDPVRTLAAPAPAPARRRTDLARDE